MAGTTAVRARWALIDDGQGARIQTDRWIVIEGEAIARLYQEVEDGIDGLIMNPAGFTYSGFALRDAILGCTDLPYVEVHIGNLEKRGMKSALANAAIGVVAGFGLDSYRLGLEAMVAHLED